MAVSRKKRWLIIRVDAITCPTRGTIACPNKLIVMPTQREVVDQKIRPITAKMASGTINDCRFASPQKFFISCSNSALEIPKVLRLV